MYDDKLNKQAIGIMLNAPIFMFLAGYWALGNPSMFFGMNKSIIYNNEIGDPDHHLFMSGFNQTHFIFIIIIILLSTRVLNIAWEMFKVKVLKRTEDDDGDFLE